MALLAACRETENREVFQEVSRCSSRLWRGSLAYDAWSKVAKGDGAWSPKKKFPGFAVRPVTEMAPSALSGELLPCHMHCRW